MGYFEIAGAGGFEATVLCTVLALDVVVFFRFPFAVLRAPKLLLLPVVTFVVPALPVSPLLHAAVFERSWMEEGLVLLASASLKECALLLFSLHLRSACPQQPCH